MVGDMNPERLRQAESFGCVGIDLTSEGELGDKVADIVGEPVVDAAVDAVGFEARGHGEGAAEAPATVLNDAMTIARAGAGIGIPGLYVTGDPGAVDDAAKEGTLGVRLGLGWSKSNYFVTGQCPVKQYNRKLMNMILSDKADIGKAVNATVITLDQSPEGYASFDQGVARKYVIDPHGMVA